MAWTAFPSFIVGHISSAADWNTYVVANGNFLATPPMARVYRNAASTGLSANPIVYDTKNFDSANAYATGTGYYTVPVNGNYLVQATWVQLGTADGQVLAAEVFHNGVMTCENYGCNFGSAGNTGSWCQDLIGPCAVGDTLNGGYVASQSLAVLVGSAYTFMWVLKVSN